MRFRALFLCLLLSAPALAVQLSDYLPDGVPYDPGVPRPADVLGFEVGEWHLRHDLLVRYMEVLAEASPRVQLTETGRTHEGRRLLLLAISTPENIRNLEALRRRHLEEGETGKLADGPLVVWHGHSVHGNEPSGANMAPLLAYHLAAGGGSVEAFLRNTVVLIEPSINPDGLGRFAQWANSHRSARPVGDRRNREHNEVWPGGRTNHYWFDLNRDWLLLAHPESRARVAEYRRWRPHVLTDFHEMGSDSTFFFQPGVPERRHPLTPPRNHELTVKIGAYHARALDRAGRLYYSEETFDDFYYGKGSTYPDVNGTVGILFEQASSRGHLMHTVNGPLSFPDTIGNQFRTALSTMEAADALRDELREWQAGFWNEALALAAKDGDAAYVFGDAGDRARALHLIDILARHDIAVHELAADVQAEGRTWKQGAAWVVPLGQRQYRLIKAVFETRTEFEDETFYDVSAFNLPLSFNLPYAAVGRAWRPGMAGAPVGVLSWAGPEFRADPQAVAYAFEWTGYYAPRALQRLLAGDFSAYAATEPMTVATPSGTVALERGAIFVPLGLQARRPPAAPGTAAAARAPDDRRAGLEALLGLIAREDGVTVHPVMTGSTPGSVDLGSPTVRRVQPVRPLLVIGDGVRAYDAGEVWHLLDTRVDLPLTMVEADRLAGTDLREYTHVILVDGGYGRHSKAWKPKLDAWVKAGGVLVAMKGGADWATKQGLHSAKRDDDDGEEPAAKAEEAKGDKPDAKQSKKGKDGDEAKQGTDDDEDRYRPYASFRDDSAKRVVGGAIFKMTLDTTHPIGYGYRSPDVSVMRAGTLRLEPSDNPYETVARYPAEPLVSGYASVERRQEIGGSAAIVATRVGGGTVIRLADNPNFRGVWYGTNKLFLNALFFGPIVDRTQLR